MAGLATALPASADDPHEIFSNPVDEEQSLSVTLEDGDTDNNEDGVPEADENVDPDVDEETGDGPSEEQPPGDEGDDGDDSSEDESSDDGEAGAAARSAMAPMSIDGDEVTIDFLGTNDFHGRLSTDVYEGAVDQPGALYMAAAVEAVRAENPDTFFVGAGDHFGGSTFVSMINDEHPTVAAFSAMGMDVSSLGNHEFDQGEDKIRARMAGAGDYLDPDFDVDTDFPVMGWEPYLGANVYEKGTDNRAFEPTHDETVTVDTDDGPEEIDIRFIGLVTDETPSLVTPTGIEDLEFRAPKDDTLALAREAKNEDDIDIVVVLTHDGAPSGEALQNKSTNFGVFADDVTKDGDIDAIFSGHTHVKYTEEINEVPVLQTGSFSEALGQITLTWDLGEDEITDSSMNLIDLEEFDISGYDDNDVVNEVREIVAKAEAEAEVLGAEIVGDAGTDLDRAFKGNGEENRGGESVLGNLIADVQLWAIESQGATDNPPIIAFMNPGGIRTDVDEGEVTYQDVATVQPFGNTLEAFDLTGAQINEVLEEQWQPEGASRPFLKLGVAGLWYFYDPDTPEGEHITYVEIDGEPLDEDATYRVLANNFLAAGGDNFDTLGEGDAYADTGMSDLDAFVEYFKMKGEAGEPVVLEDDAQRAIGVHWNSGEDATYAEGEEISLDLSSLIFTSGEPKPEELNLYLVDTETGDEVEVGTTPVDSTVADDTTDDESGRAEVRVEVPDLGCLEEDTAWELHAEDPVYEYSVFFEVMLAAQEAECDDGGDEQTPPPEEPTTPPGGDTPPGGELPETGAELTGPLAGGALLLALGGLLVALRRRNGSLV